MAPRAMALEQKIDKLARRAIVEAGYTVTKLVKDLGSDPDGVREVLFIGKYKGDQRAHIPGDSDTRPYTLYLHGSESGGVGTGW